MTTPQAPSQQQAQQKPPRKPPRLPPGSLPPAVVDAIAVTLAAQMETALTAAAVIALLRRRYRFLAIPGLFWLGLLYVLSRIVLQHPPAVTGVIGAASQQVSSVNAARRAQFAISAAQRVAAAMQEARSKGGDVNAAADAQIQAETRYFQQHLAAMWNRSRAAGQIDMEAAVHGPLLGWAARHDRRVTAECLAADHHNFYVNDPPDIGLPGIGPHVGCRCEAVAPWPAGKLLPSAGTRRAA